MSDRLFVCQHPGCKHSFARLHDLRRHNSRHDVTSQKRGCPYPGSGCRIRSDEKHQLYNWYEHIVTVHQGYRYMCDKCSRVWRHKKGIYTHEKDPEHPCHWKHRDPTRRERDLAEKDWYYRNARAELLLMREQGAANAWNDSWPESLPEYINFMRKLKALPSQRSVQDIPVAGAMSSSPDLSSLDMTLGTSDFHQRFRSNYFSVDPLRIASTVSSNASLQVAAQDVPQEVAAQNFSTFTPFSWPSVDHADGDQINFSATSSATSHPVDPFPLITAALEAAGMHFSEPSMTQEEIDRLGDVSLSSPPTWDFGFTTTPTLENSLALATSPYSETVPTPHDRQYTLLESSCFNGGGTVAPEQLRFYRDACGHE